MSRVAPALLALLALLAPSAASAYCRMTTSHTPPTDEQPCPDDGVPLAWTRPCIGVVLDERGSKDLDFSVLEPAVRRSFDRWTGVECDGVSPGFQVRLEPERARCDQAYFDYRGENANVITFVDDFEELGYDPTAFAVTIVWHSTDSGEIFDADILVNERFSPFAICPTAGCLGRLDIDLENVLTHEIGHFFGLAHSEEPLATMYASAPRGEIIKRTLDTDDVLGFCEAYPEPLTKACDFTPHGGLGLSCGDGPSPGGRDGCGCQAAPVEHAFPVALSLLFLALVSRLRARRRA